MVLPEEAFVLRFFGDEHGDRLLVVNFGRDLRLDPAPKPLCWLLRWTASGA